MLSSRKQTFSSIMFKTFASSICRLNIIAKRKRINCCIKICSCNLCFDRDIKCLITKKFFRYIEYKRFNRKYNLISSSKKINKTINVVKKLNNKIFEF